MRTSILMAALALALVGSILALPAARADRGNPVAGRGDDAAPGGGPIGRHDATAWSGGAPDLLAVADLSPTPKGRSGNYIIVLTGEPLATYTGGTGALKGTSPTVTGAPRLDPESAASHAYLDHLAAGQARAVDAIERTLGRPVAVRFRYRYALNGLALALTPREAERIRSLPGIAQVVASRVMPLATDVGPRWIGAPGVWDGSAMGRKVGTMGEGVVVGIIDTGINIDHPSFAAVDKYGYEHLNPKGRYLGFCDPDNPHYDAKWQCNEKLIGLYSFVDEPPGNSFVPEDANGHGSHTASTVAGNFVAVPLRGPTLTITREISGMAPHANIVAYDTCGGAGCADEATIAALDQAVADQVDVVNYSIGTSRDAPWSQPVMQAFFRVRQAGIFAAVSAGNNGPGAATTAALPPWVLAVAAASNDRVLDNRLVDLAGGDEPSPGDLTGGSLTAAYGPAPIVYAGNGAFRNDSGEVDDGMCNQAFPPDTWHGEIVACDRGDVARLTKATYVQAGGAGGFVLMNSENNGEGLNFDGYAIPGIQLGFAATTALKTWLAAGTGHTARIRGTEVGLDPGKADVTAGFSGRGPALVGACCRRPDTGIQYRQLFGVLKPDIIGPGVDVLAAVASPEGSTEPEFDRLSGTSMSGPHLAGAAALVRAARPGWSVAEAQSALMTTAITNTVRKQDGQTPGDAFDQGAGRVAVDRAVAAGLVLDATPEEMRAADPLQGGDVRQVNLASLADPFCLDSCSWTRTLSSTLDTPTAWTVVVQVDERFAGLKVAVTPARFRLEPGQRQRLAVEAAVSDLTADQWAFGQIVLRPDDPSVPIAHLPLAVRPVRAVIQPVHVAYSDSPQGASVLPGLRTQTSGPLSLVVSGLARGETHRFSLLEDPTPGTRLDLITGTQLITFPVPSPSPRIVVQVDASEAPDIDLFVGVDRNGDGLPQSNEQLCMSAGESWTEYCEVESSDPDLVYWAVVQNYTASEDQPDDVTVVTGVVPALDAGNLTVTAPERLTPGEAFDLRFAWSVPELQPDDTWFSLVAVGSGPDTPGDLGRIAFDLIGRAIPATPTPLPTVAPTEEPRRWTVFLTNLFLDRG